jgi:hypothetical protein
MRFLKTENNIIKIKNNKKKELYKMVKMDLKELQDYLGITDNDNYMYKADVIGEFRDLEKLIENMKDYKDLEIILKEDYYNLKLNNRIMYEGKKLIIYYNENKTQIMKKQENKRKMS